MPESLIHPSLVLLTVSDQAALEKASSECLGRGIACSMFHEDDMDGEPTAFATRPVWKPERKVVRKALKNAKLFGGVAQ